MEKLSELLNSVHDSYFDFVVAVLNYAKRNRNNLEEMTSYLEQHPDAGSSEIIEFMISRDNYYEYAQRIVGVAPQMQHEA